MSSLRIHFILGVLSCAIFCAPTFAQINTNAPATNSISRQTLIEAQKLLGLEFSDSKLDMALASLRAQPQRFERMRAVGITNAIPPALWFDPRPAGFKPDTSRRSPKWTSPGKIKRPARDEDLAFMSVGELGVLLKSRQVKSEELARLYLDRLKKYGPKLDCVITLTEELALEQARRADREIAAGKYRGPLHGIPYGAKDLLAVRGYRTTWGSAAYKEQVIDADAEVVQRLEKAGAVLVAKLTLGELALGDVWFAGRNRPTRNPWDLSQGSSGSSAGSACATSAGLVAFGIGSETWGSIVSPCERCGVTGLRPTFGRVPRTGAMALSWSMDKLGPICRTVEDCALVFNAIAGPDGNDQSCVDAPFNYDSKVKLAKMRIGYLKKDFEKANRTNDLTTLDKLRELGAYLIPLELPKYPVNALSLILNVESASAFDDLTRSGRDDLLVLQGAWPNTFRRARFVPAVEYLQANRVRWLLLQEMAKILQKVDLYVAPADDGDNSLLTNLTGHPAVAVPNGFTAHGTPTAITFIGKLYGEAQMLAAVKVYQDAAGFYRKRPPLDEQIDKAAETNKTKKQ
ncbi:MAG: amidase [Verrucomicrobia bacterium]|nr:amidase [Verrucomicrobiota bacterium]